MHITNPIILLSFYYNQNVLIDHIYIQEMNSLLMIALYIIMN